MIEGSSEDKRYYQQNGELKSDWPEKVCPDLFLESQQILVFINCQKSAKWYPRTSH